MKLAEVVREYVTHKQSMGMRGYFTLSSAKRFASKSMKAIEGYHLIKPEDLFWRPSNLMKIPNTESLQASLFAALNPESGEVLGKTSARHTSAEFVAFLEQIVASQTPAKEVHIIADNLSAHRTSKVREFLERNRNVRIHYTPTYSSWLNRVEIWFSKIQRDVIARGIFVSVKDLESETHPLHP
jgi:transposase